MEAAPGQLLWEMDRPPDVSSIERSLYEFSAATHANGLIHGDVRPWNVVVDDQNQIRVIDWNLSCFLDDLRLGDRLLRGHFAKFHRSLKINEILRIDRIDAERIVALLRGQIRFPQAWAQNPSWYPAWCQH